MMKKLAIIITATILSISISAQDPHWNTDGNTGTNPNDDFVGTIDDADLRFRTDDEERMTLTGDDGWLGLGTNNPTRKFHLHEATDPFVDLRITKTTNTFGLRIGLTNEGVGNPGRAFVRMDDDAPLLLYGHGAESMRLTREFYSGTIPENTGQVNRVLLRYNMGAYLDEPYSMLTMGRNWPAAEQDGLERDWMNVGTTCLFNADILYTGLIEYEDAVTDAVTVWGCQEGGDHGPDNYRFLFISGTAGTGDAAEEEGRETMRITPLGNVGIGDFSLMPNGLAEQPTQKLDVDGTARLRQMPNNSPQVVITGVEADDTGDYILNYATFEEIGDELEINIPCDWDVVNGGDDVAMGFGGACVTEQMLVGTDLQVGTNAKAFLTKDYSGTTIRAEALVGDAAEIAGYFEAGNVPSTFARGVFGEAHNSRRNVGVEAWAHQASQVNYGFRGVAENGQFNYGGYGSATDASSINFGLYGIASGGDEEFVPVNNVGVYGRAENYASEVNFGGYFVACDAERNIGVYAETCDHGGVAVHAVGSVQQNQGTISLSDETIKTGIEEIGSALDIIGQLNPIQYEYLTDQFPHLKLADDMSYGFSAQEVQQVLPDVVEEFYHPAKYDTSGEMISPSEDLLGIQYQEFIAILTAGVKEQQAQIDEQEQTIYDLQQSLNNQNDLIAQLMDQMDALADQVNNCCDGGFKYNAPDQGQGNPNEDIKSGGNVLDQNTPNPFRSQTTISYSLETGGKVLLNVYDKTGKILTTLEESEQSAGTYRYEWDASGLPAGLYHYALYVDGELLVKKAIKLAD